MSSTSNIGQEVIEESNKFIQKPSQEEVDSELGPMLKSQLKDEEGVILQLDNQEDIQTMDVKPVNMTENKENPLAIFPPGLSLNFAEEVGSDRPPEENISGLPQLQLSQLVDGDIQIE